MADDVIFNQLPEPPIRAEDGTLDTRVGYRDGSRPTDPPPDPNPVGVLFQESFDDQPDWHSELPENEQNGLPNGNIDYKQYAPDYTLPLGWQAARQQGRWNPAEGHPDRPEVVQILASNTASNPNMARGGTGKSMVKWRHSYAADGVNTWSSDGILAVYLGGEFDEVYVEFYANFSNEMIQSFYADKMGTGKWVRVCSHDNPLNGAHENYFKFFGESNKPLAIWSVKGDTTYGIQNKISVYRYSDGVTPISDINEGVTGMPREFNNYNDADLSYSPTSSWGTTGQDIGGGTPELTDYKNGGIITQGPVMMDQLFGDETQWVKCGWYLKINSAPGVKDGLWQQFIDDKRVMSIGGLDFVSIASPYKKWNMVMFGGNDNFTKYDDSERHVEWYGFDDITIRDSLPEHLRE